MFSNPYEPIKTLNSLKLTLNRNNDVSINSYQQATYLF